MYEYRVPPEVEMI